MPKSETRSPPQGAGRDPGQCRFGRGRGGGRGLSPSLWVPDLALAATQPPTGTGEERSTLQRHHSGAARGSGSAPHAQHAGAAGSKSEWFIFLK